MPGFAAASLGMSVISGISGAKSAKKSRGIDQDRLNLERERDNFNRGIVEESNVFAKEDRDYFVDRRNREESMLDPIQRGLVDRANEGPDFEGAAARSDADVSQAFGVQRQTERIRRERYGINPASGVAAAQSRRVGNSESLARVQGRNRSYLQEDDRDWARKIAALGTGNMRNATPATQLGQLGVSGASGVMRDISGGYADNAAGAFGLAGKLFADSRNAYGGGGGGGGGTSNPYQAYTPASPGGDSFGTPF